AVQPDGTIGGPNYDFCETFVLVQDNMFDLCDTGQGGIAGYIETEENQAIEGVDVNLSGDMNQFEITGSEGTYTLYGLTANGDYTITPLKDTDHKNGVSTFDIVVIMRHILNVQLLDSPYKMIAADVDNSGSISISDLIAIRKLVLSVTDEFENNTSWRFVDAAYNFPEPTNPWLEEFPEIVNINDLEANSIFEGNFVGVKIGDVTGDVQPNSLLQVDDRTNGVLTIQAADQELQSGQEYEVVFTAAELSTIAGYQWTMRFDEQRLELVDVMYANAKAEHFYLGYTDQGLITSSVDLPQGQTKGEELFRLKLKAKANVRLSEALSLNSRLTKVEAYRLDGERLDVALAFGESQQESGYALYQNVPNPFQAETTIAFELPQAMSATIKVQDITGRTLRIIRGDFAKGYNEIRLTEAQLEVAQSASAVLMYTLETADFTATRKMILIE
ncbi:MAG: hypothetical protein MRY78_11820, partial [Saprospiraceae bacterium]|nr:hypothetical protein [Saprospiraceae bacterium]